MSSPVSQEYAVYNPEYYQKNKEAHAIRAKAWRENNQERAKQNRKKNYEENKERNLIYSREYNLKKNFKLSLEEYTSLLKRQEGKCAICGKLPIKKSLAVDHDHETGKIRGLLCGKCNRGIGYLGDDSTIVGRAHNYLILHELEDTK